MCPHNRGMARNVPTIFVTVHTIFSPFAGEMVVIRHIVYYGVSDECGILKRNHELSSFLYNDKVTEHCRL